MALDYGRQRTGVAISDASRSLATPLTTVAAANTSDGLDTIARLIVEHDVTDVVVGLPLNMDGSRGPQADRSASFADRLRMITTAHIHLHDERLTSQTADRLDTGAGDSDRDSRAAAVLLDAWIEASS